MKKDFNCFVLVVAILTFSFMTSCNSKNTDMTAESESKEGLAGVDTTGLPPEIVITKEQFESSGMKVGDPSPSMFRQTVSANGYITASPSGWVKINTLIPGRVKEISRSEGDYVNKGQVLFTMEGNEIILLQQEYAEAFNQLNSLKTSYERQKALSEEKITSQKDFIETESNYRSLLSKTEGLKARLKMIHIDPSQVEQGTIISTAPVLSPIQGFITKVDLVMGQFIEPQVTVMELIDIDQLQLNIYAFENDLKMMAVGQQVLFYDPDDMEKIFEATLTHIGKSIDPETRTVLCKARIRPADRKIFVNSLYVKTEIITCQREAPAIPVQAYSKEGNQYYVLVMAGEKEGNLIFHKVPVHLGVVQQEYAEVIDEGLKNILMEGAYNLLSEE